MGQKMYLQLNESLEMVNKKLIQVGSPQIGASKGCHTGRHENKLDMNRFLY